MQKRLYLKSISDTLVGVFNEIISAADIVSINVTNTISANVMSTMSTNSDGKNVSYKIDCYILLTVLLVIIFYS